jgi:uncharacterized OsmC-like protein
MITSTVYYEGGLHCRLKHERSGTEIVTDAPVDNNGKGEAFSPTDLVATSLASCMITIMGMAAEAYGFNIDGTRIEVTKIMDSNPRRISEIILKFYFPHNNYTDKQKEFFRRTADTCPVAKSLHPELKQTVEFIF